MKRYVKVSFLTFLSVIFLLTGCGWFQAQEGNSDVDACVYYIEENGTVLVETNVSLPELSKEEKAERLIEMLLDAPQGKTSPICDGTKLISVTIKDEIATVDFSKEFSEKDDLKNILAPAAVAKTLCSLEFISGVNILVEGSGALDSDGKPIGIIMESDIVDGKLTTQANKQSLTLYFADEAAEGLKPERREVIVPVAGAVEEAIVEELIKGPKLSGNIGLIPSETKVLSVETKNNVCFVNLSKEFADRYQGGTAGELLTVYSIVNSLTELETVTSVQFLIEGEKREEFIHMVFNEPIVRDSSFIKK